MTKEFLNELMNALVDGTVFGICFGFWVMVLMMVWRWFLSVVNRFLHWLFPKRFPTKKTTEQKE
ncbi:MAG: hypothetical protein E7287_10525 [Lachnospiraceae bacterium]|nr:hypothetical protein [Lachnospiraceae bacterium]